MGKAAVYGLPTTPPPPIDMERYNPHQFRSNLRGIIGYNIPPSVAEELIDAADDSDGLTFKEYKEIVGREHSHTKRMTREAWDFITNGRGVLRNRNELFTAFSNLKRSLKDSGVIYNQFIQATRINVMSSAGSGRNVLAQEMCLLLYNQYLEGNLVDFLRDNQDKLYRAFAAIDAYRRAQDPSWDVHP